MITNVKDVIAPCLVCGRRLKIPSEYLGRRIKCRHCHGQFVATHGRGGGREREAARALLDPRLRQMLKQCALRLGGPSVEGTKPAGSNLPPAPARPYQTVENARSQPSVRCRLSSQPATGCPATSPSVLLVEHRDEVYARLAADLAEAGFKVGRARTAREAMQFYARSKHALVVANLDLPDQSGWLLAGKLHFIQEGVRMWLYEPRKTATDVSMAKFLRVDELLEYGGNLIGLSDAILDCVAGTPRRTPSPQRPSAASRHRAAGTTV
jgi:hypothetical protein